MIVGAAAEHHGLKKSSDRPGKGCGTLWEMGCPGNKFSDCGVWGMDDFTRDFGERVRIMRKLYHYSREYLSELIDVDPQMIGRIERGENTCTVETALRIADAFNVPISILLLDELPEECSKDPPKDSPEGPSQDP